jgi:hypothetical protein
MAFYSAFQTNAFWNQAFQIARTADTGLLGGKDYSYVRPHDKHREEEYQRKKIADAKAKLRRVEEELADAEARKLEAQANAKRKAALKAAALQAQLEEEISRLRNERVWLMRLIDEEEALLIIKMIGRRRLRALH